MTIDRASLPTLPIYARWPWIGPLGGAVALVLLAAGIGLVNRRRWGLTTARTWAVLKFLLVGCSVGISWHLQTASFQSNPAFANAMGNGARIIAGVSVVIGLAWGWALPAFVLVWLSRSKIKAETAAWK